MVFDLPYIWGEIKLVVAGAVGAIPVVLLVLRWAEGRRQRKLEEIDTVIQKYKATSLEKVSLYDQMEDLTETVTKLRTQIADQTRLTQAQSEQIAEQMRLIQAQTEQIAAQQAEIHALNIEVQALRAQREPEGSSYAILPENATVAG